MPAELIIVQALDDVSTMRGYIDAIGQNTETMSNSLREIGDIIDQYKTHMKLQLFFSACLVILLLVILMVIGINFIDDVR